MAFTIIPTKELVYSIKIRNEGITTPANYEDLIRMENRNIKKLARNLTNIEGAVYVDVVTPLQQAALGATLLYPDNVNGHPVAAGYAVIGKALAAKAEALLPERPVGLRALMVGKKQYHLVVVGREKYWIFASHQIAAANGWKQDKISGIFRRDIASLTYGGMVSEVDPDRFGVEAFWR